MPHHCQCRIKCIRFHRAPNARSRLCTRRICVLVGCVYALWCAHLPFACVCVCVCARKAPCAWRTRSIFLNGMPAKHPQLCVCVCAKRALTGHTLCAANSIVHTIFIRIYIPCAFHCHGESAHTCMCVRPCVCAFIHKIFAHHIIYTHTQTPTKRRT